MQLTNLLDMARSRGKKHVAAHTLLLQLLLCYYLCLCCSVLSASFPAFFLFFFGASCVAWQIFVHKVYAHVLYANCLKVGNGCSCPRHPTQTWNHPVEPPCSTTSKRFESLNALLTNHIAQIKAAAMWLENSL